MAAGLGGVCPGVSVVSRWCLSGVSVVSPGHLGGVSVVSWFDGECFFYFQLPSLEALLVFAVLGLIRFSDIDLQSTRARRKS